MSMTEEQLNKMNTAKDLLRKATFSKPPAATCSHLLDKEVLASEKPRFIATQILEDSYNLMWCCKTCATKYHVPEPGILVALEKYCSENTDELIGFETSDDEDCNPYQALLDDEGNNFVPRKEFERFVPGMDTFSVMGTKYRIPFGIKITKIKK